MSQNYSKPGSNEILHSVWIGAFIFNMKDSDHIAVSCSTSEEINEAIISNFVLRGLKHSQINLWLVSQEEKERFIEILKKKGMDVKQMIDSQELIILDHAEIISDMNDSLSANPIMSKIQTIKKLATERKKSGINAIATLGGHFLLEGKFSNVIHIEKYWNEVIESIEIPITVLHPYYLSSTKNQLVEFAKVYNCGQVTVEERSQMVKQFLEEVEDQTDEIYRYKDIELGIFPNKELAIFKALKELTFIIQDKDNSEKGEMFAENTRIIPRWYFNIIELLNRVYDNGNGNKNQENEKLR